MYKQTEQLCCSLPRFSELFKAADRIGSAQWQIITWENIAPEDVQPDQVTVCSGLYESRTEAVRASFETSKPHRRIEKGEKTYNMVWKWLPDKDGNVKYQSVMPILPYRTDTQNGSHKTEVVRETSEAPTSTMVRISEKGNAILRRIADEDGKTLQAVLDDALQEYEKQRFFKNLHAAYQALRDDPQAWTAELKERALWDTTLMDGLDRDEIWHEDGTVTIRGMESDGA